MVEGGGAAGADTDIVAGGDKKVTAIFWLWPPPPPQTNSTMGRKSDHGERNGFGHPLFIFDSLSTVPCPVTFRVPSGFFPSLGLGVEGTNIYFGCPSVTLINTKVKNMTSCTDNNNCAVSDYCVKGTCTTIGTCSNTTQCTILYENACPDFTSSCSCEKGICVRNRGIACTADTDCKNTQYCDQGYCSDLGQCDSIATPCYCPSSVDCVCDYATGQCKRTGSNPKPPSNNCTSDSDCTDTSQYCLNSQCTSIGACSSTVSCKTANASECPSDSSCTCTNNVCYRGGSTPSPDDNTTTYVVIGVFVLILLIFLSRR